MFSMATAVVRSTSLPLILLVNHETVMLRQLAASIRGDSYQVETATSSRDALERLQRRPLPSLVLMNVGIPGDDGLEALRQARQLYPDLRVVMLGKVNDTRSATQAVRLGALDYLPEPVVESELEAMLQQYVVPDGVSDLMPNAPIAVESSDVNPAVVDLPEGAAFVCGSASMKHLYAQAALIAKFDMPVLMLSKQVRAKRLCLC
jgi:CheY-like chemotaxis protein